MGESLGLMKRRYLHMAGLNPPFTARDRARIVGTIVLAVVLAPLMMLALWASLVGRLFKPLWEFPVYAYRRAYTGRAAVALKRRK